MDAIDLALVCDCKTRIYAHFIQQVCVEIAS